MTDRIEAALAALDRAAPGKWMPSMHQAVETEKPDGTIKTVCICSPIDAILIAAAPDLAAEVIRLRKWQSEAVKWLPFASADQYYEYLTRKGWPIGDEYKKNSEVIDRLISEAEEE